jgi:hypothetical protein
MRFFFIFFIALKQKPNITLKTKHVIS